MAGTSRGVRCPLFDSIECNRLTGQAPESKVILRIISWNIRAGGGKRAEGIVSQLLQWQPDIIALSEFRGTDASRWIAGELGTHGYPHQRTTTDPHNPAVNSLLLASRWPLRLVNLKHAPENKRRWLHANIASPTPVAVMAMHIPNRSTGLKYPFMESTTEVVKHWRGPPAVLLGDTNSGCMEIDEESPAFNKIEDQWIKSINELQWKDAFRELHGEARDYTWYSPNGRNGFRLDQAFLHPALHKRVTKFEYVWGGNTQHRREDLSDHAAIILDIKI